MGARLDLLIVEVQLLRSHGLLRLIVSDCMRDSTGYVAQGITHMLSAQVIAPSLLNPTRNLCVMRFMRHLDKLSCLLHVQKRKTSLL